MEECKPCLFGTTSGEGATSKSQVRNPHLEHAWQPRHSSHSQPQTKELVLTSTASHLRRIL
jgi:hypothetical protein